MRISIVIPAFNEERLLADTLGQVRRACEAFEQRGWMAEVIVCDNNSTDATASIAASSGAKVVFEPINQISRARNRGAASATGDWLIFVDADSQPSVGLFEDVATQIEGGRCLAGGAIVRLSTHRFVARFFNGVWNAISRYGTWLAGSFIFVEARAFRALGGFSDALFVAEELEFSNRLKKLVAAEDRQIVILRRHPITTSARKVELYSTRELVWFFLRALVSRHRVMRSRQACHPWYDGRR